MTRREARIAMMRKLQPHQRHEFDWGPDGWPSYQTCRFCRRGHGDGLTHLWKYSARHWVCDDCKTAKETE